jgi:hypothetical protein
MLPIRHIHLLETFFSAFDAHLINSLASAWPETETAITRNFWAMLRGETPWAISDKIQNPLEWLKTSLARDGFELDISLSPHAGLEKNISFADFGLHFRYINSITKKSKEACYIVQAKSLYRNPNRPLFEINDTFKASSEDQRSGLQWLGQILGENAVKFMAYTPRVQHYDVKSQQIIRALQAPNVGSIYTGNQLGLTLAASIQKSQNFSCDGVWLAPTSRRLHTSADLHARSFFENLPLSWFVIANLFVLSGYSLVESNGVDIRFPWDNITPSTHLNIDHSGKNFELARGLALCDNAAIKEVASKFSASVPASVFRPTATLSVTVTRAPGSELDLEMRLDPRDDMDPRHRKGPGFKSPES